MSQRNLLILTAAVLVCVACFYRAEQNPFARYVSAAYEAVDQRALVPVPEEKLFGGAIEGMVGVLREGGDIHSAYISELDIDSFMADLQQEFGGIGVRVSQLGEPPKLTIVGPPEPGTPAFRADIRPGDEIVAIDDQPTEGLEMDGVLRQMRGEPGSLVRLSILHRDEESPVSISLVREIITVDSILGDRRLADGSWVYLLDGEPRIAYVRITTFGDKTVDELATVLDRVVADGAEGIVLDLRDNAGGAMNAAISVCEMFLPAGLPIVETRGRDKQVRDREVSTGNGPFRDVPLAVLVNQFTASASEIVSACLQDHGQAIVVGQRSYGKGTVQELIPLASGRSQLKLTLATFWRPSGENIHRMPGSSDSDMWGVRPDEGYEVPLTEEEYVLYRKYRRQRDLMESKEFPPAELDEDAAELAGFEDRVLQQGVAALRASLN